ncbi:HECT-domain-containing protein, partial [Nadsonia fulvescens var. elongata DSM 6958]
QWANMVIALELYSYWLIIADDTEFRSNVAHGLALNDVQAMATFLRNFTFTLLWNLPMATLSLPNQHFKTSEGITTITLDRLRTAALRVMKQIYIRDSRRAFLPDSFWLMTNKFDMEVFIPAAVEEEERRYELSLVDEDDSDDDDSQNTHISVNRTIGSSGPAPAVMSRLNILQQAPFFIPFNIRVSIFQAFIALDQARRVNANTGNFDFLMGTNSRHKADVRREFLLEDAYEGFNKLGPDLKSAIGVTFYNDYGPEAGIDGGGITKEFLTSVCKEAFNPSHPLKLFASTAGHLLYPNPAIGSPISRAMNDNSVSERITYRRRQLSYIEFLGRIIGKCLYEGILVDVEFAPFFLQKWTNRNVISNSNIKSSFDDLYWLDPELYNGLIKVHKYPGDVEHDLGLNFTTMHIDDRGQPISIDLKRGGGGHSLAVTNANRLEYIHAVANFKLNTVLQVQTNAFITGMSDLISANWLSMFNAPELQMLVSGGSAGIDIADLRRHTLYGGYLETDETVSHFWEVLEEFTDVERRKLIKFVTSVARAPLLGFEVLRPLFAIRNAGSDKERLPTASTCVNLLKLPDYKSKSLLRKKLLYAINAEAGFDLS